MKRWIAIWLVCMPVWAQPPEVDKGSPVKGRPDPRPWSGGVFMTTDSQPYRGADGIVRVFPFVSYRSRKLQWYGPFIRYRVAETGSWSFFARGQVDFGAYDEEDSDIFDGLGDRSNTLLVGVGVSHAFTRHWKAQVSVDRDVLGAHDGTEAVLGIQRDVRSPFAPVSGGVSAGVRFQDTDWTRDRVGVPTNRAREDRPAYSPDESLHLYLSGRVMYRVTDRWVASVAARYEWLDDSWRDSPLVDDRGRFTTTATLSYSF